jgi:hypothetical protein
MYRAKTSLGEQDMMRHESSLFLSWQTHGDFVAMVQILQAFPVQEYGLMLLEVKVAGLAET